MLQKVLAMLGQLARWFLVSQPPRFTLGYKEGEVPPQVKRSQLSAVLEARDGELQEIKLYFDRPELLHWENRAMIQAIVKELRGLGFNPENLILRTPKRTYSYWVREVARLA